uniref:Uncharacterized protein n=1 Tax=Oryza sativa subsp. indica TaxID=39946 RepID=A0A679B9H9_ORYSI|nr:hypothetical protein [Oryza sativa Indica Group]
MADDDMWGISMARSIISAVVKRLLGSQLISSDASDKLRNLLLLDLQTLKRTEVYNYV